MAVTKQQKSEILAHLVSELKAAKSVGFAQTNAMTVSEFSELRTSLRTVNTSYTLAKKTIVRIAVKEVFGLDLDLSLIPGQIGVIASKDDSIAGLSKTNAFITAKFDKKAQTQKITWAASIFDGEVQGLEETKVIASMPSRETLLGRLVGSMMSPLSGMARFLDAAAKEVETSGKAKLGDLKVEKVESTPAPTTEETVATETSTEEKAA